MFRLRSAVKAAAALVAVLILLVLSGCPPTETPGYSPDGKTIALVAFDRTSGRNAVWLYDVAKQVAQAHHVPGEWTVINAQWIGPQLWVECSRSVPMKDPKTGEKLAGEAGRPVMANEHLLCPFDAANDDFVSGAPRIVRQSLIGDTIRWAIGTHEGKPALFVESDEADHHEIYTLPGLSKVEGDGSLDLLPAGGGWSVRVMTVDQGATRELREVQLLDDAGQQVCRMTAEAIAPACHRGPRLPVAARIAADKSVIALAFDTDTIFRNHERKYTFGVFSVPGGKLLWAGGSDSMDGVPLVSREEAWSIELVERKVYTGEKPFNLGGGEAPDPPKNRFSLVRHRPGKSPGQWDGQRDVVFTYALGENIVVRSFAPSPDGSHFLVTADGPKPCLLFVPIRTDAGAKDVKVVELK
jgi:hypothetical protein